LNTVFFQFASSSIHFVTSLEILQQESLAGNKNFYCCWGNKTSYPGRMSRNFETINGRIPNKIKKLILKADNQISVQEDVIFDQIWVEKTLPIFLSQIKTFTDLGDLKKLEFQEIFPGAALANEITSVTKSRDFDFVKNLSLIEILLRSYLQIYSAVLIFIRENNIARVNVYNGRFLHERAVWDSAKKAKVEVVLFENIRDRYLQRKEGFHDRINNQREMIKYWEASSLSKKQKIEIGSIYFDELRGKTNPFSTISVDKFKCKNPYLVYFSNSDDEAVGFWENWNETLGDQISCIKKIQAIVDNQEQVTLVIRLHPNLKNKSHEQRMQWSRVRNSLNSQVIAPDSQVSSYEILDGCIGSISFGSTLGLESAFSSKPHLLLADSGYDHLDVADKALSWEDVEKWIKNVHFYSTDVLSKRKENACIRGLYLAEGGTKFKSSSLRQVGWGAWEVDDFCGIVVKQNWVLQMLSVIISKYKFWKIEKHTNV
jgi:hypothetical protein